MNTVEISTLGDAAAGNLLQGSRPLVNSRTGQVMVQTQRGMTVNSVLRKDEWEELDTAIVQAAVQPLNITRELQQRGLVRRLGDIGVLLAQYSTIGEMTAAEANLRGHSSVEKDLAQYGIASVPVPIVHKEFELDARMLASSRRMGNGLDVANGAAAARVVAEKVEDMVINGDTGINLNGNTIYGLTNHPNRNTDTATNYGGGDWGTINNVTGTIAGMISAAQADGYYGPYGVFASNTQYNQAALAFYTDGSGQTPLQRVTMMNQIEFFLPSAQLSDGAIVLLQLTRDVVELAYVDMYWPVTNLEWTSGDSLLHRFKVMTVFAPIVKAAANGRSGIVHATAA